MSKQILHDYAMSFLGKPYLWGGDDPIKGLDCSGFVIELLTAIGFLPYGYDGSAKMIHDEIKKISPNGLIAPWDFGSCAFFGKSEAEICHIGFCLSNKLMIEAGGGDSTVVNAEIAAQKNAFIKVRPIKYRRDFLQVLTPDYKGAL